MNDTVPKHQVLAMPALSPTMERGNISKWNKKEGDKIKESEPLAEVSESQLNRGGVE